MHSSANFSIKIMIHMLPQILLLPISMGRGRAEITVARKCPHWDMSSAFLETRAGWEVESILMREVFLVEQECVEIIEFII
jgi:hypothetical protein